MIRFRLLAAVALTLTPGLALAQAPASNGVALADIDHTVKPGDDFYHYANGEWIKHAVMPADRSFVGGFSIAADRTDKRLTDIVADATRSNPAPGTEERLVADLYASYMNTAAIEKAGTTPLHAAFAQIDAIKTPQQLARALGETLRADTDALNNTNYHTDNLFGLWVAPDFNDPDHYTAYLMQGGLQLPDRDYYISDDPKMSEIRTQYQTHIATVLRLAGFSDPEARAAQVYALELAIAKAHISLADSEDIHKANNPWTLADLTAKAPGLDWKTYLAAAGLDHQPSFIIWQPTAFTGESALVASTPLDTWKNYLRFHEIEEFARLLPKTFAGENFAFYGKILNGSQQQRPREIRGVYFVDGTLGDALGKIYASRYFSAEDKARVQALVANLIAAFHQRLEDNTWMAPATKAEAIAKLGTLKVGVGYADKWRSYAGLEIKADDLAGNLRRSSLFDYHYELSKLGQPVDRKDWVMTPQTVNAVNLPLHNGLNFPAAMLQPPFYDPAAPDAYNYGAIGSIIGHEVSHTFDSEGAAFDSRGRVRNWWTPEDFAHFKASTAALTAQFDAYEPFPGVHVNGRQTLGENIADLAGLNVALDAFHASLKGQPAPVVEGLTGDQQFFLAFAQNWGSIQREAQLRAQITSDPHALAQYRADTVRNLDAWYPAFEVKPGETLYLTPDQRIHIW
jgi:putative endopeptidase